MKIFLAIVISMVIYGQTAMAADKLSYADEMYSLGTVCGQGLACKSQKYHQFELLARAIIVSKAANDQMQREGMRRYNDGKAAAFMSMEDANFADCDIVREDFDNQKIFQSILYSDGRIKMYNGELITPRKPYEAAKLYVKDREAFVKADAAYKKYVASARKNAQNAKKVPLYDASYKSTAKY